MPDLFWCWEDVADCRGPEAHPHHPRAGQQDVSGCVGFLSTEPAAGRDTAETAALWAVHGWVLPYLVDELGGAAPSPSPDLVDVDCARPVHVGDRRWVPCAHQLTVPPGRSLVVRVRVGRPLPGGAVPGGAGRRSVDGFHVGRDVLLRQGRGLVRQCVGGLVARDPAVGWDSL